MSEIWRGKAYPLGATYDGSGTNFALFSEAAERVELCLFDEDGAEDRVDASRGRRLRLARLSARGRAGSAVRLPGARTVRSRRRASVQPEQAAARSRTRRRSTATSSGINPCSATTSATPTAATTTTPRPACPSRSSSIRSSTGVSIDRRSTNTPRPSSTRRTSRVSPRCTPTSPSSIRGTYAGIAHPVIIEHLQSSGHHRDRADAGASLRQRLHADRQGAVELLGLQHDRLLRAGGQVHQQLHPWRAGAGVQVDGARAARSRHRGDPRRGLQPHRRGQPPRANAVDARDRQRRLLPAGRRRQAVLHGLHRHRQHASTSGTRTRCS